MESDFKCVEAKSEDGLNGTLNWWKSNISVFTSQILPSFETQVKGTKQKYTSEENLLRKTTAKYNAK